MQPGPRFRTIATAASLEMPHAFVPSLRPRDPRGAGDERLRVRAGPIDEPRRGRIHIGNDRAISRRSISRRSISRRAISRAIRSPEADLVTAAVAIRSEPNLHVHSVRGRGPLGGHRLASAERRRPDRAVPLGHPLAWWIHRPRQPKTGRRWRVGSASHPDVGIERWPVVGPLASDAHGASTLVVGMAAMADGLVALTFENGQVPPGQDAGEMLKVAEPLRSWRSPDGTTWTDHPGPDVDLPSEAYLHPDDIDWLQASTAPLLLVAAGSRPPFVSTDAVPWTRETTSGLPAAFSLSGIKALGSGFVAVRDEAIATSRDGRAWTKHGLPTGCSANEGLVIGRDGFIAAGLTEADATGVQPWIWCGSLDGQTWRKVPDLPPLGRMSGAAAQECQNNCPDGKLIGDGERMVAYRGWGDQVGWTSFDGRKWQPLAFKGHPETSSGWLDDGCTQSLVLMPMGVRCMASNGVFWFGEPRT